MYIDCVKNNGKPYLRLAESYSVHENGVRKNRKRTIKNIGPLARFDDGKPDYLPRLRTSFKEGNPLISELLEFCTENEPSNRVVIEFNRDDANHYISNPKNIGYFLLEGLYKDLGIYDVLTLHKSRSKIEYDLNGLAQLLVFGRMLSPKSKLKTFEERNSYLFDVTSSDSLPDLYRALDVLNEKAETIQQRMNLKISNSIGRNTEVCFYDVTNYYFEIGQNDEDLLDDKGNIIKKGLRKKGVSKEKRSEPIVQMGLFIDENGIPISYRLFSGNETDTTTLRPALKKSIDKMKFGKVVIVADGGLNSEKNIAHILKEGNGYIVSKSTKKSSKEVKKWILNQEGYACNKEETFKVKSMIRERKITDENGEKQIIKEKIIAFWSKEHYDKQVKENESFVEYLESVIENPNKLKSRPKKIEKYLVKTEVNIESGEVLESQTHLSLNLEKIEEEMALMGYYTILTSEIEKTDDEIINTYHGLSRIEDSFRIIKSDLEGRPVYVHKEEHINAHFLICFIALTMSRIIQYKVLKHQGKDTLNKDGWESGVTTKKIQEALNGFKADALPQGYFRLTEPNEEMKLILESLGIDMDLRLPTISEIRKLKSSFNKTDIM